jgi:hypothetical protein
VTGVQTCALPISIEDAGIQRIQTGVVAMINNINDFGNALRGVSGINLDTELQALNSRLGLNSSGELRINQQPITLNVNFTVSIDAVELENVLLGRPGTRFTAT